MKSDVKCFSTVPVNECCQCLLNKFAEGQVQIHLSGEGV